MKGEDKDNYMQVTNPWRWEQVTDALNL